MVQELRDEEIKTVVIVGAGAAGLQSANILLESDAYLSGRLKILILEAKDRVGGRISIDKRWGVPFDCGMLSSFLFLTAGPNWIHGTIMNPLIPLTKISDSQLTFPEESRQTIFTSYGDPLPPETSHTLYQTIWKYADEAVEYSTNDCENIPSGWSMYDFCVAKISQDQALDMQNKVLALHMTGLLTTFTAVDVKKQSLRYYRVEAELPGECPFVASTFEPILRCLAQPCERAGILHLSSPVTRISQRSDSIGIGIHDAQKEITADAVILTVPLGCLQQDTISFTPPLPSRIQSAIANLGFGNLEKLFLKFRHAWWITHSSSNPPEFYTFLPPHTLPQSAPTQVISMFSLASLPINAQPVLVAYLAGEWSSYLASQSLMEIKDLFQSSFIPCLPNYSPECAIVDVLCTNWSDDFYAYGSYTHIPVGSLDGLEDLRVLGERIYTVNRGTGGLWLAGEHAGTADVGTVNGAMTSGAFAATDVLKAFGERIENYRLQNA